MNIDIEQIQTLAQIMQENGLSSIKIDNKETVIELKREISSQVIISEPAVSPVQSKKNVIEENFKKDPALYNVESPMVGMFYSAPNPNADPYVDVGDKVKPGDVLCIVEAMKLMNEIVCEVEGTIEEICVTNEQVVEFGQPLFKIRRSV